MTDCECKDLQAKCVLLEERQTHLREVMDLRFTENETATKLSAAETLRRLELLNGEAGRLTSMQATYLPREIYDRDQRALADNLAQSRRATIIATVSAIGSLLLLVISWLLPKLKL
jgi:hypothetical protein